MNQVVIAINKSMMRKVVPQKGMFNLRCAAGAKSIKGVVGLEWR